MHTYRNVVRRIGLVGIIVSSEVGDDQFSSEGHGETNGAISLVLYSVEVAAVGDEPILVGCGNMDAGGGGEERMSCSSGV